MKKRVFIFDSSLSNMLNNRTFGGIAVQFYFWSKIFIQEGWEVHTLSFYEQGLQDGIFFHRVKNSKIWLLNEWRACLKVIRTLKPQLCIERGAHRKLLALTSVSRMFGSKVVLFGASDVNFVSGKATVGNKINRWCYERGLANCNYFVAQNSFQAQTLLENYGKQSIVIPNIWRECPNVGKSYAKLYDAVWIANFRRLKRAEWFVDLARNNPQYKFAMAGGDLGDNQYFNAIKDAAAMIDNLEFKGSVSFRESNELLQSSKLLVCSSEYEGFPNTFIQAWAQNIPVISTVNPGGVIAGNNLGIVVETFTEMEEGVKHLLADSYEYSEKVESIGKYFSVNHSSKAAYQKLMTYIGINAN